jgi:long-chain acyl-CoA synthetase
MKSPTADTWMPAMVFCDDQEQVDKIVEIRERVPSVKQVIYEDPRGMRDYRSDDWFIFIEDLYRLGDASIREDPEPVRISGG